MIVLLAVLFLYGAIGMNWRRAMYFNIVTGTLLFAMALPVFLTAERYTSGLYQTLSLSLLLIVCELLAVGSFYAGVGVRKMITFATRVVARRS